VVAGASDLRSSFEELGAMFEEQTGTTVTFSFGSSGQLAQQVQNGAPFDLFASADVAYIDEIVDAGKADPAMKETYAFGRLAIWSKQRADTAPRTLDDLSSTTTQSPSTSDTGSSQLPNTTGVSTAG